MFQDAVKLYRSLPITVGLFRVPLPTFAHFDFLWGIDAKNLLYDLVTSLMNKFWLFTLYPSAVILNSFNRDPDTVWLPKLNFSYTKYSYLYQIKIGKSLIKIKSPINSVRSIFSSLIPNLLSLPQLTTLKNILSKFTEMHQSIAHVYSSYLT